MGQAVKITFVTGVSGSGKTTVAKEALAASWVHVDDIDGDGTPDAGHLDWLRWRGAQLLYEAVTADTGVEHFVICGITWPHAIIDSNAWPEAEAARADVRFVLLDVPHKTIKERLGERLAEHKAADRRALLRYNRDLAGVLRRQVAHQRHGEVLAAGRMTPAAIADYVIGAP